jgi:hypothetical protein
MDYQSVCPVVLGGHTVVIYIVISLRFSVYIISQQVEARNLITAHATRRYNVYKMAIVLGVVLQENYTPCIVRNYAA